MKSELLLLAFFVCRAPVGLIPGKSLEKKSWISTLTKFDEASFLRLLCSHVAYDLSEGILSVRREAQMMLQ
jgi:hypothetical protein